MNLILGLIPWAQYSVAFLTAVALSSFAMKLGAQLARLLQRNLSAGLGIKIDPDRSTAIGSLVCLPFVLA